MAITFAEQIIRFCGQATLPCCQPASSRRGFGRSTKTAGWGRRLPSDVGGLLRRAIRRSVGTPDRDRSGAVGEPVRRPAGTGRRRPGGLAAGEPRRPGIQPFDVISLRNKFRELGIIWQTSAGIWEMDIPSLPTDLKCWLDRSAQAAAGSPHFASALNPSKVSIKATWLQRTRTARGARRKRSYAAGSSSMRTTSPPAP